MRKKDNTWTNVNAPDQKLASNTCTVGASSHSPSSRFVITRICSKGTLLCARFALHRSLMIVHSQRSAAMKTGYMRLALNLSRQISGDFRSSRRMHISDMAKSDMAKKDSLDSVEIYNLKFAPLQYVLYRLAWPYLYMLNKLKSLFL